MIVRWPGKVAPGQVSDRPWGFLGFPAHSRGPGWSRDPAKGIDGLSRGPVLTGGEAKAHESLYWEFHERGFSQAVRMKDWKAVRLGPTRPIELYDLSRDIDETMDVAGQNPDVVARMKERMVSSRTDSPDFPIREGKAG